MERLLFFRSTCSQPVDGQCEWLVDSSRFILFFRCVLKSSYDSLYDCLLHPREFGGCDFGIRKFIVRRESRSVCSWSQGEDHSPWVQENNKDSLQYERTAIQVLCR